MDTGALRKEIAPASLPELHRDELTPELLREKMGPARCVVIRGLIGSDDAQRLSDGVDRAFAAYDDPERDPDWFKLFQSRSPYHVRSWLREHGGVLAVDCPPMMDQLRECYRRTGLMNFVREFLGDAVLSSFKTTLRLTKPETRSVGWHQDGAFLGKDARTLNVWLALTHCGIDAASLDVALARKEEVVGAGEDGAMYEWSITDARVRREAGQIATPVLAPGDAVVFDHLCLHRTAAMEATKTRKAIEAWFFTPATLPKDYDSVPL